MILKPVAAIVLGLILTSSALMAQGVLPAPASSTQTVQDLRTPLLIEQKVPDGLLVTTEEGKQRSLLSFKSPLELIVAIFLSPSCDIRPEEWTRLRHLTQDYKDWKVVFLAISAAPKDAMPTLAATLKHEKLLWPLLHDEEGVAAGVLKITAVPETVIIDEYGVLKYRGPTEPVRKNLDVVISHVDTIKEPEPAIVNGCAR